MSDIHRPIFLIVVSSYPCSLRAMAPLDLSEWAPMRSGSIACFCNCNVVAAARSRIMISLEEMCVLSLLLPYWHRRESDVPP